MVVEEDQTMEACFDLAQLLNKMVGSLNLVAYDRSGWTCTELHC